MHVLIEILNIYKCGGFYCYIVGVIVKKSIKKGFSFGLTSGIITTLGLMVGLYYSTHSQLLVLGGILIIAVSDSLSDAFGIHMSEESDEKNKSKDVWEATFSTFISKVIFALTFVVPVFLLNLQTAIIVSIIWGFFLISLFSYYLAKQEKLPVWKVIGEHLTIAVVVVILTQIIGSLIG